MTAAVRACVYCGEHKSPTAFLEVQPHKQYLKYVCLDCDDILSWDVGPGLHARSRWHWSRQKRRGPRLPRAVRRRTLTRAWRLRTAPGGPYDTKRPDYQGRRDLYDGKCAYCQVRPGNTLDHAVPVSRGGSNWPANIYPACSPCQIAKGDRILHKEWQPRSENKLPL